MATENKYREVPTFRDSRQLVPEWMLTTTIVDSALRRESSSSFPDLTTPVRDRALFVPSSENTQGKDSLQVPDRHTTGSQKERMVWNLQTLVVYTVCTPVLTGSPGYPRRTACSGTPTGIHGVQP